MSRLILVRHAAPTIDPDTPSADWPMSAAGQAAAALAGRLAPFAPDILVSDAEPKMTGTAAAIGERLGLVNQALAGLAEHARRSTRFGDRATFEASIQALFSRPGERVYGDESANETYERFAAALNRLLAGPAGRAVVAVSGGTAISLFLARRLAIDPFPFWKALRMPQAFVISTVDRRLEATVS